MMQFCKTAKPCPEQFTESLKLQANAFAADIHYLGAAVSPGAL
jgi:hypothetical protein